MSRCVRREEDSYQEWNARRYERARQKFHDADYVGFVQTFLRVHWMWAIDVHDFVQRLFTGQKGAGGELDKSLERFSFLMPG
eukprot:2114678-Pyramimonas_sp.AAC.1